MNGRNAFEKYKRIFVLLNKIVILVPNFFFSVPLRILDGSESRIAILTRYLYIKKNALSCGDNVFIGKYVILKNIDTLRLGSNISIHAFNYIDAYGGITIGDNVSIANHTSLISFDHTWEDKELPIKYNLVDKKEIHIDDDVWIGNGCRILSGVTINHRSVVAAGAVVNKDVLRNSIVGGVPAKRIKEI